VNLPSAQVEVNLTISNTTEIDNQLIAYLWSAMAEIYGSQWTNEYSEQPNGQWIMEIKKLTMPQIAQGIEMCKQSGSPYVPRLPQFLAYCGDGLTKEQRAFQARCKAGNEMKALPKPDADPEIRRTAISAIKKLLRGGI
jgi:hypothetical protein